MSDQLREAIEHWYDDTEHGICPHSLRDEEAVLVAARRWLAVEEAEPIDDEFGEMTMVLAWIDVGAINRRDGEWVGVCGDARPVSTEGET